MPTQTLRVSRTDVHVLARPASIQRQLERYRSDLRPPVGALAQRHVRLAELSRSFPALLAALARPRAGFDPGPVIASVIAGAPLGELSRLSGVPLWLRRLSPALVVAPLPQLPDSPFLASRIVNHFPRHPRQAVQWFSAVSDAALWAHEGFALWCAQNFSYNPRRRRRRRRGQPFRLLCLWAWYSGRPETRGHALMETRWNPEIQLKAAQDAAWDWQEALGVEIQLAERPVDDLWHQPGRAGGYDFLPLRDVEDLRAEARAMHNCVRTYSDGLAHDLCRLWSVQKGGERIATLEVGRVGQCPIPMLRQLCLKDNAEAPPEVWLAAHEWLGGQASYRFSAQPRHWSSMTPDTRAWRALWKPYWLAMRRIPTWLPLSPSRHTLYDL